MNRTENKLKTPGKKIKICMTVFSFLAFVMVALGIFAPLFTPNNPTTTSALHINEGPSRQFPFGTDRYGRCVCSRVMMGARTSIFSAATLVIVTFAFGTFFGMIAGYYGGAFDAVIMRTADVFLAFPQMVLAIAVAGILGGGMFNAMLAMGITGWTLYARLARAHVLSLKGESYIYAARLSGFGSAKIMLRYMLPNMLGPLVVNAATQIGTMMIGISGLSFLGIGVTEPQAEWGSMINASRAYIQLAPWAVMAPAIAILVTVMVFNYLSDCIRDYMDVEAER